MYAPKEYDNERRIHVELSLLCATHVLSRASLAEYLRINCLNLLAKPENGNCKLSHCQYSSIQCSLLFAFPWRKEGALFETQNTSSADSTVNTYT